MENISVQELEVKLLIQETELARFQRMEVEKNKRIRDLISEKENLTKEIIAKGNKFDSLYREKLRYDKFSRQHGEQFRNLENNNRKLNLEVNEQAKTISSLNWILCGCVAISFCLAYRVLRPPKPVPPKKLSLVEIFSLYFTDTEEQ